MLNMLGRLWRALFCYTMEVRTMAKFAENSYAAGADFIRFGQGSRTLIMLPGLGDGLKTVRGTAVPMAWMYRGFSQHFTVYALSRRRDLPQTYTTRQMAADVCAFMTEMGIEKADILGVSMGGMIAQWLAIDHPEKVDHLILTVTCPCPNPILNGCIGEWIDLAQKGDHTAFMDSNLKRIYSDGYYQKYKLGIPLVARLTKPDSYDRFLTLARACLDHDALGELPKITAKTYILGGQQDICLGADPSRQMASLIPGSQLRIYPQWGHGLYEEAKDFNQTVLDFLLKNCPLM